MRAHLPFTEEERVWREEHFGLTIPERHFARVAAPVAFAQPVHGFDVSSYQPAAPDFRQGGRGFAIFKATEGTGYVDPHLAANRTKAHAEVLPFVGLYHFARPSSHAPADEARFFLSHVGARQPNEVAVLDYEVPPWSVAWVVQYLQVLTGAGWPTEFYSYLGMLSANPTDGVPQTGCGLWVAAYGTREPGSDRWPAKDLWQHTDGQGSVPGNDGPWDCSVGSLDVLVTRAGGTPGPPVPPGPPPEDLDDLFTTTIVMEE